MKRNTSNSLSSCDARMLGFRRDTETAWRWRWEMAQHGCFTKRCNVEVETSSFSAFQPNARRIVPKAQFQASAQCSTFIMLMFPRLGLQFISGSGVNVWPTS